jgi:hypothetical protein
MWAEQTLTLIKLAHTGIWAIMAGAIVAIPIAAMRRRFRLAAWLSALIVAECIVLALNRGRCPLTDLAAGFTADRAANFDIFLPRWLAQNNKVFFGGLFVAGELLCVCRWLRR